MRLGIASFWLSGAVDAQRLALVHRAIPCMSRYAAGGAFWRARWRRPHRDDSAGRIFQAGVMPRQDRSFRLKLPKATRCLSLEFLINASSSGADHPSLHTNYMARPEFRSYRLRAVPFESSMDALRSLADVGKPAVRTALNIKVPTVVSTRPWRLLRVSVVRAGTTPGECTMLRHSLARPHRTGLRQFQERSICMMSSGRAISGSWWCPAPGRCWAWCSSDRSLLAG